MTAETLPQYFYELKAYPTDIGPQYADVVRLSAVVSNYPIPYIEFPHIRAKIPTLIETYYEVQWVARTLPLIKDAPAARNRLDGYVKLLTRLDIVIKEGNQNAKGSGPDNPPTVEEVESFQKRLKDIVSREVLEEILHLYMVSVAIGGHEDNVEYKLNDLTTQGDELINHLLSHVKGFDTLRASLEAKYLETATGQYATLYADARFWLLLQSCFWFFGIIALLYSTSLIILKVTPIQFADVSGITNIQTFGLIYGLVQKVLVVSILLTTAVWFSRMYVATRHNAEIAKHKELALKCLERFVTAASQDEDTKNAVIQEVTRSIFSLNSVGYASSEMDNAASPIINTAVKMVDRQR